MPISGNSIFVIFAGSNPNELETIIASTFPTDYLKVGNGEFLVASPGTSKEVSDKLGVTTGTPSSGIVVSISGYYGRTNPSTWEWIKAKWQSGPHD